MNKVHKVIRSRATGLSTVTSEIAKGKTKSTSNPLRQLAAVVATASMTLVATPIWAGCTNNGGNNYTCSDTDNSTVDTPTIGYTGTNDVNVNATNWNLNGGRLYLAPNVGAIANVMFTGNNVNIDGESNTFGLIHLRSLGDKEASISIGNSTISLLSGSSIASSGLVSHAGGKASVSITGNTTVNVAREGLHALGTGAEIKVTGGNNHITATGTAVGSGVNASARDGHAVVTIAGANTTITTAGNSKNAINAVGGQVTVNTDSGATLKTDGTGSHGIYGESSLSDLVINNQSAILTEGSASYGISAVSTSTAGTGNIRINNKGIIETTDDDSHAIFSSSVNDGIAIVNSNELHTAGVGSHGIYAKSTGSGAISITNTGSITTTSAHTATSSKALYAVVTNGGADNAGIKIAQTGGTIKTDSYDGAGIYATTNAKSGDLTVDMTNTIIELSGRNADGIYAINTNSGISNLAIKVTTTGGEIKILEGATVDGGANYGIVARQAGTAAGDILVNNKGTKISTDLGNGLAPSSAAIDAQFTGAGATGNISITNSGELSTKGAGAATSVIYAVHAGSGKIDIINTGNITVSGSDASGIRAQSSGAGDINITHKAGASVISTGNATTRMDAISGYKSSAATGNIFIQVDGDVSSVGSNRSAAVYAQHQGVGNATVIGTGNITASATNNSGTSIYSYGLAATVSDGLNAAGNAAVGYSQGTISTGGDQAFALYAGVVGKSGTTRVENSGTLMTTGINSSAIWARNETTDTAGKVDVINSGRITTAGDGAHGIYANLKTAGSIDITNAGEITTAGLNSRGIYTYVPTTATSADVGVVNTGNITSVNHGILISNGAASGNSKAYVDGSRIETLGVGVGIAILASESSVHLEVKDSQVIVHGKSGGVTANRNLNATTVNNTTVKISNSIIDGRDSYGADALTVSSGVIGNTFIHLDAKTHIYGGWKNGADVATGIGFNGLKRELINEGHIEALSDWAIRGSRFTAVGAQSTIKNYGTITGYMSGDDGDSVFNNFSSNSWNIRNFADTDGDQIRDTKAVAVSDFGLGNDTFKNESTGTIRLAAVTGETTVDATNEYITAGALSINNAGTVQGQLLNLNTFENRGTIDLTENNQAGDVLLISGGATAGTYGGGQFVSDGGSLKLDTVLNDGGVNSLSDILVIDDSTTASGATKLYISQTGTGDLTQGEGIKVIETLGTSSSNSFALGKPVAAGLYEYILNQGSSDQNWYLSSRYNQDLPIFNPSTGAYLANQSAASSLFMHTLYDRQGHANNVAGGSAEKPSVWVRAATSSSRNQSVNGMMGTKTDASLIHLGGDVAKWQNEDSNLHLGLMGAYGQTDSDVTSQVTHTTAKGKVTGYALGVYGTWFADEAQGKGLYVDGWAQYGWYKNKVSGAAQINSEEKYDSTNWTTSIEAGYGIHLHREDNTDLMLTPQVQVTYNHYSADDHKDGNNLSVSGSDASGVMTRLGARLSGKAVEGYGARPYMEANWVHNTAKNELNFNGEVLKDGIPKDKGELKLGLQGTIAKNWKVWGQVGGQWGGENYERYEGQVGVNYQW